MSCLLQVEGGAVKKEDADSKGIRFFPRETGRIFVHPASTLFSETR